MRYLQPDYLWLWITVGLIFSGLLVWAVLYLGRRLDKILEELRRKDF